jgi:hypothetical protein
MVRRTIDKAFNYRKQMMVNNDVWVFYSILGYFEIHNPLTKS